MIYLGLLCTALGAIVLMTTDCGPMAMCADFFLGLSLFNLSVVIAVVALVEGK